MKYSLRSKLSLSYLFISFICIFLISILSNIFLEKQFREYVINKQEAQNQAIAVQIGQQYQNGKWDENGIERVGLNVLQEGLIIHVKDINENTVWDAAIHNYGLCALMLEHVSNNMMSRYPNWNGEYVESILQVYDEKNTLLGTVQIGYYGPFFFNDNELSFINTLNKLLIGVGALSLLLSFVLGYIMSKRLSKPIAKVINVAQLISKGCYNEKIQVKENTKELVQLTNAVNSLAETLEKHESMQKRLTADVTHELRTPLATLQSHIEAIQDGIWKPDAARLGAMHKEIVRITKIVGDLEELNRFECKTMQLDKETFDITSHIEEIIRNFQVDFDKKGVALKLTGEHINITADKDKISQMMINLLSNALKYTDGGDEVSITAAETKQSVEVTVRDTGKGIAPEDLPNIFIRFYRADKSRNRATGGSGIGLTIVKTLVEAHGGTITAKSEQGKWTEFTMVLPK